MGLMECREELDRIDAEIAALFERRMQVCEEVARVKIDTGKPVLDRERERKKLDKVASLVSSDTNKKGIRELFAEIMTISRRRQYQMLKDEGQFGRLPFIPVEQLFDASTRVVYQGAPGSYSEAAMKRFFGADVKNTHVDTFRDAMVAIEEGNADYAVLPIENSTAGIVSDIFDLLVEFENYIVGEVIVPIRHCLLGVPGTTEETIETVYSHAQSLMQSENYLRSHAGWQQVSMANNAFAARFVAEQGDPRKAAIASSYAAEVYGLQIVKEGVNQEADNSTRFIIVSNQKIYQKGAGKISLCLEILHESGSLYHLLSHIIYNGLNMTKIESRPIRERSFEYRFFIDFDGNLEDAGVRCALRGLRDEARSMRILGNY